MMKTTKKLGLARQTVRNLGASLGHVRGGDSVDVLRDLLTAYPPFTDDCMSAFCRTAD